MLEAPMPDAARTRFIIAMTPLMNYAAEGLSGPFSPEGLPESMAQFLNGARYFQVESETVANLTATMVPVADTDNGTVKKALWHLKIEREGEMIVTGNLSIDHCEPIDFLFDTPPNMKLLSCTLGGQPISPVALGGGQLKIYLPAQQAGSEISCSFTGKNSTINPVDGTLHLALPTTPRFIHELHWHIDLPDGYQAETHGNLTRYTMANSSRSRVSLRKHLIRNERPEVHVFYQRSDLPR